MTEALMKIFDHVSVEHVVSEPGLVNVYQFTHDSFDPVLPSRRAASRRESCAPASDRFATRPTCPPGSASPPSSTAARCASKRWTSSSMRMDRKRATWRSATSRRAACTSAAGSRRRRSPRSSADRFLDAFRAKGRMRDLVTTMPVSVILQIRIGPGGCRGPCDRGVRRGVTVSPTASDGIILHSLRGSQSPLVVLAFSRSCAVSSRSPSQPLPSRQDRSAERLSIREQRFFPA